jgi:hypothetical protein
VALSVILIWYIVIGAMSVAGTIAVTRKLLSAKAEQIFFGAALVPIAAVYLAFTAYLGADDVWRLEAIAVALFAVLGIVGMRVAAVLVLGYVLHGVWDLFHEIQVHAGAAVGGVSHVSQIPLAYGAFCATYDWCIAVYFYLRRAEWNAAWGAPG